MRLDLVDSCAEFGRAMWAGGLWARIPVDRGRRADGIIEGDRCRRQQPGDRDCDAEPPADFRCAARRCIRSGRLPISRGQQAPRPLSYRDVEELLVERGLDVSYETVRRWVLKFGPLIARKLRQGRRGARGQGAAEARLF